MIWHFKASNQHEESIYESIQKNRRVARILVQILTRHLRSNFGKHIPKLTFVCAPVSNQEPHKLRYKYFSDLLCKEAGMENAYEYIWIQIDGHPKHTGGKLKARMFVHPFHIRDKFVLLFDDFIARDNTLDDFKALFEHHGARVTCIYFIGRTL